MNNKFPAEHLELIESINNVLKNVQNKFDIYQNNCFTERSAEFFCLELNGEAGELANLEKKHWKGKEIPDFRFYDEAADVFIALMNYCNARGIDIENAVINKLNTIENKRAELQARGELY